MWHMRWRRMPVRYSASATRAIREACIQLLRSVQAFLCLKRCAGQAGAALIPQYNNCRAAGWKSAAREESYDIPA